jgi:hypothetical protein
MAAQVDTGQQGATHRAAGRDTPAGLGACEILIDKKLSIRISQAPSRGSLVAPEVVSACEGWTAHEVTAHLAAAAAEIIRHLQPYLHGEPVPKTRPLRNASRLSARWTTLRYAAVWKPRNGPCGLC